MQHIAPSMTGSKRAGESDIIAVDTAIAMFKDQEVKMGIREIAGIIAFVGRYFDFVLIGAGILNFALSSGDTAMIDRLSAIALIAFGIGVRVLKAVLKKRKM